MFKYVCPYAVFEQGVGGEIFLGPRDPTFLLSTNRDVLKNRCVL